MRREGIRDRNVWGSRSKVLALGREAGRRTLRARAFFPFLFLFYVRLLKHGQKPVYL